MRLSKQVALLAGLALLLACGPAATAIPTQAGPTPTAARVATPTVQPTPAPAVKAEPKRGGTLRLAFWDSVPTWDVFSASTLRVQIPLSFVYDRLFVFKTQPGCVLETEPSLAKTWKWVNDTTLEIGLQPGARFANRPPVNGREVTADDVVYSFMEQTAKKQPSHSAFLKASVERMEAVDKGTVRFVLKAPNAFFLERAFTRASYVAPKETFDAQGKITVATMNVGSGPFILDKDTPGVSVAFVRNPDYWDRGLPYVDGLDYKIVPDLSTQMALFRTGALEYAYWQAFHPMIQEAQRTLKDYDVQTCYHSQPPVLGMVNTEKPFDDVRVRRAISMAIDRQTLIKGAYLGMGLVTATAISPDDGDLFLPVEQLSPEARRYLEYNPQEARRLLAEAGYPDGIKVRLWNTPTYGPTFGAIAESLVASFRPAGITAELYSPEYGMFLERWYGGRFDGLLLAWHVGPDFYQSLFDGYHSKGARGGGSYKSQDAKLDSMIDQITRTFDKQEQIRLAKQVQVYIAENVPTLTMPLTTNAGVVSKRVKGVYYVPTWEQWIDHLRYAWIDR
ncbi:MAG: ABC transporter substrate-binding protein [Chloroflexi bacterium]|nr:ABC transporter substrate-binding protein [Chloroflexota bacterium]